VWLGFPPVEIALGRWPNFSLLKRSFIVSASGYSETKSLVVSLSIKVAVVALPSIVRRIFMVFAFSVLSLSRSLLASDAGPTLALSRSR